MNRLPSFKEFKRIAHESRDRLERKAAEEGFFSLRQNTVVSSFAGWRCDCGFETFDNEEFYNHLVSHEMAHCDTQKQLYLFHEP